MAGLRILVSSCDDYSDCWPAFFHGLRRYWPDCPYPVSLISNQKTFPGVDMITTGEDRGWANNLLAALDRIHEPYVLYAQEDYWIDRPVEQAAVAEFVASMEEHGIHYVRLIPLPPPDGDVAHDPRLAAITVGAPYRTALQMALWRTDVLRQLVEPGMTGWQFETEVKDEGAVAFCVRDAQSGIHYILAIARGKWCRAALEYTRREGLRIDFSQRPTEKRSDVLLSGSYAGRLLVSMYRRAKRYLGVNSDPSTSLIR